MNAASFEPSRRLGRAKALLEEGDVDGALTLLERDETFLRTGTPRPLLASLQLRLTLQVRGPEAAATAIGAWAAGLACEPKWVRNAVQVLHRHLGRTDEAVALLRRCLAGRPADGPTHACLADLLQTGAEREHHLREAALGHPPHVPAVEALCRRLAADGEQSEALAVALAATKSLPEEVRLKALYADLALDDRRAWPTLETTLRAWLAVEPVDELLEQLVTLYVRSDKWSLLLDVGLPTGRSPETQALIAVARATAGTEARPRLELDHVDWSLATPLRWLPVLGELLQRLAREGGAKKAAQYVSQLPDSFAPCLEALQVPTVRERPPEKPRSPLPAQIREPEPAWRRPPRRRAAPPSPTRTPSSRPPAPPVPTPAAPAAAPERFSLEPGHGQPVPPPPSPRPPSAPAAVPASPVVGCHSRRLIESPLWQKRKAELSPRVDVTLVYRLLDALGDGRVLHENEAAELLGVRRHKVHGFVAEVAGKLNVDAEPILLHDRRAQTITLDLVLLEQCYELPPDEA